MNFNDHNYVKFPILLEDAKNNKLTSETIKNDDAKRAWCQNYLIENTGMNPG